MKTLSNPPAQTWGELIRRPQLESEFLESAVRNTLNRVKRSGDHALRELTLQYDGANLKILKVSEAEIEHAISDLNQPLKNAIQVAASNIQIGRAHV